MTWLVNEALEGFFSKIIEQAINLFLQFLASIGGMATKVLEMSVVTNTIQYSQAVAITILMTKIAYEAWMTYILRMNGDPEADPGGLLVRSMASVAIISSMPWLVLQLYQFGSTVATDIAALPGKGMEEMDGPLQSLLQSATAGSSFLFFAFIGVLFAVIMFIIILIQSFIRAAELAVAAVVGCFMALGLTNSSSQAFGGWFKEVMSLSMAQAVQMFLIKVSFFTLTENFGPLKLVNLCVFCGFLWVTYKSPSILKSYIHSTGVGKAAGGAAQSVGSMVMMRRFFK